MKFVKLKRTKVRVPFLAGVAVALAFISPSTFAVEPWVDKKLTVTNGLEIWLDAGKEIAARQHDLPTNGPQNRVSIKIMNGGAIDRWHDASGNKRDVSQLVSSARPRFIQHSGGAAFRFDGVDDFFSISGLKENLDETTIFILAAPHANKNEFGAFLAFNRDGENDYRSGLNVDMANGAKRKFDFVNVEGTGFVGVQDLMTSTVPFDEPHVLSITAQPGTNGARLWIDGVAQEIYGRNTSPLKSRRKQKSDEQNSDILFGFDQITVGARFFSN
ncbi:MAG: hypothetical protein ABIR24_03995, partial [Verrucomicrobiota bacterium]